VKLDSSGGRSTPQRSDSRSTRARLVDAIGHYANEYGLRPTRLTDVAELAGVAPATAYRHFASVDEAVNVYLSQLPEHAVALFERRPPFSDPVAALQSWNECWVKSCHRFAGTSIGLRSPEGFLARRRRQEPVVSFVCAHIEPLLQPLATDPVALLAVWNAVSDPREVLDLRSTLRWSGTRVATFITEVTVAAAGVRPPLRLSRKPAR
jgi:AcrR family transcriptional regulator